MEVLKTLVRQSLPILVLCIMGEIAAGIFLMNIDKYTELLPGLIILVPSVMGTRGNILGIFTSRLASGLHLGTITPNLRRNKVLKENAMAMLALTVVVSLLTGVAAHLSTVILGFTSMGILRFAFVSFMTGFMTDFVMIIVSTIIGIFSFKLKADPDNVTIPLVTTISDFTSITFLLLSVQVVLLLFPL